MASASSRSQMTSPIDGGPGWHIDPATLLPVLDDESAFRTENAADPALEVLVALWSGDPDRAATLLQPLIAADPTSWRLQALAAEVIRDRGDTAAAITILESLVGSNEHTPREAVLVQHLGKALFSAGDYPRAAAQFRRALTLRSAAGAAASLVASSNRALGRALDLVPRPLTHTRAWGWGVAFLHDPVDGEIPDDDTDGPATFTPLGLRLSVRHADDVASVSAAGGPAEATIHLDRPAAFTPPERAVVVDVVLETPSRSLWLGDAEDGILLPAPGERSRVVVSHDDREWNQPDEAWIDLYPAS